MKDLRLLLLVVVTLITISCKKQSEMKLKSIDDITQIKWISDANYEYSPWNSKMMPTLLDFKDSLLCLNFSNTFLKYEIKEHKLFLDGIYRFNIVEYRKDELYLENDGTTRRYVPLKKGSFNESDKKSLDQILETKDWVFKNEKTKFDNYMLSMYDEDGEFKKGGIYALFLFNQNLIISINIDGSKERELYFVKKFDTTEIILNKRNNDDTLDEVIIKGKSIMS